MSKTQILIGADPEGFFVRNGVPVPAIGLIGGTKDHPRPCGIGHVQEDNVMAEFNIPPATTATQFSNRIKAMMDSLEEIAKKHGCSLQYTSWAKFNEMDLLHPQARTIGCDPDYNAWTSDKNPSASPFDLGVIRTAAGHVHIGVPNPNISPNYRTNVVKACDRFIGIPSAIMEKEDNTRRKFYGKAGCFRPKPYGIEYRVPGNWWLTEDKYRKWIFKQATTAITLLPTVEEWLQRGKIN